MHAAQARMTAILSKRPVFPLTTGIEGLCPVVLGRVGSRAIKRVAIAVATCNGQTLLGMLAMLRARFSVASDTGIPANLPASSHGSFPARANMESRVRAMPFASVPTGARRNSSIRTAARQKHRWWAW